MPIGIKDWFSEFKDNIKSDKKSAFLKAGYYSYLGLWYTVTSRKPMGINVLDKKWDILLILDACRVDAIRQVSDEYEFIKDISYIWSVGSTSHEWLANTFTQNRLDVINSTSYITGNGYSKMTFTDREYPPSGGSAPIGRPDWKVAEAQDLDHVEYVWEWGHDDKLGNVPPRTITDVSISYGRTHDFDRLIVHYVQPHAPYLHGPLIEDRQPTSVEAKPMQNLRNGNVSKEEVWNLYLDNLRLVLNEVEILLDNIDGDKVVITSDHGEAFGELGFYDHPDGCVHPVVKKVPWIETKAVDKSSHDPDNYNRSRDIQRQQHLKDLGYL